MNMRSVLRLAVIGVAALISSAAVAGMGDEDFGRRHGGNHGGGYGGGSRQGGGYAYGQGSGYGFRQGSSYGVRQNSGYAYGQGGGYGFRHGGGYAYGRGGYGLRQGVGLGLRVGTGYALGGGYADDDSQIARGYYTGAQSNLPVRLGYTGAEFAPGGGYDAGYGGEAYGGGCGVAVSGCGSYGLTAGYAYGGGCGGGCGGNVAYPTYPLPTTSSVIYNRPSLFPGWPARAGYGYYGAANCNCN